MRAVWRIGLSAISVAALGCASVTQRQESTRAARDCVPEPVLYDWQRLDAGNLIVWTLPGEQAYHLGLEMDLQALTLASSLEFVDGNRDGFLCDEGWDSLLAVSGAPGDAQDASSRSRGAAIHYVSPLTPSGVASLRDSYAETRGERVQAGEGSI